MLQVEKGVCGGRRMVRERAAGPSLLGGTRTSHSMLKGDEGGPDTRAVRPFSRAALSAQRRGAKTNRGAERGREKRERGTRRWDQRATHSSLFPFSLSSLGKTKSCSSKSNSKGNSHQHQHQHQRHEAMCTCREGPLTRQGRRPRSPATGLRWRRPAPAGAGGRSPRPSRSTQQERGPNAYR